MCAAPCRRPAHLPYGCARQTTSTAYRTSSSTGKRPPAFGLKPFTQAQRAEMLDKAIGRLASMQTPNGGFSLWGNVNVSSTSTGSPHTSPTSCSTPASRRLPAEMEEGHRHLLAGLQTGRCRPAAGKPGYNGTPSGRTAARRRRPLPACSPRRLRAGAAGKTPLYAARSRGASRWAHSALARLHLGLALKLMGDRSAHKGRHRPRPQEARASTTTGGATRHQPARLGANGDATAQKARPQRRRAAKSWLAWSPARSRKEPLHQRRKSSRSSCSGCSFANQQ